MATKTSKLSRQPAKPVMAEEVVTVDTTKPAPPFRLITLIILLVVLLVMFWNRTNTWPIAAFVNGKPVFRFTLDQQLYKQGGEQVLNSIVTEKLVNDELAKNKVVATSAEIDERINQIKTSLGTSFDSALAAQGLTMDVLKSQVATQVRIEKLLSDKATTSAEEVAQAMKDGNLDATAATKIVKQQKLQTIIQDWVEGLNSQAKIIIVGAKSTVAK